MKYRRDMQQAPRLLLGDCLELMGSVEDGSIDMVLCDLPYGTTRNAWDECLDLERLWEHYRRIIKPNGVIALTSSGLFTARLMMQARDMYRYKMVWAKSKATNFLNAKKQPLRKHEDICVFYKGKPTYNPQMTKGEPYDKGMRKDQLTGSYGEFSPRHVRSEGSRYPTDILYFKTAESEGPVLHPTQKPVALMEHLIKTYTNAGDTVLDNCMGSGTTGVATLRTGRCFVGMEKDEEYFEIARNRMKETIEI